MLFPRIDGKIQIVREACTALQLKKEFLAGVVVVCHEQKET